MPIVIVHVSGRDPMEQVQWARARGLRVHAETCPQYIALTADDLHGLNMDFERATYVCSPLRDADSQSAIWQGLRDGTFDLFSSNHCPFRFEGPADTGKNNPRARTSFRWMPNGIPGEETRLPILFSEGVSRGRISLQRFGALTSTNPARLYGLYSRKGSIAVGADADLMLWDANLTRSIRQADLNHGCDHTPYEGREVTGWPVRTLLRGRTIALDGAPAGEPAGTYLPRRTSEAFEG